MNEDNDASRSVEGYRTIRSESLKKGILELVLLEWVFSAGRVDAGNGICSVNGSHH
jgi:hypothetical protein